MPRTYWFAICVAGACFAWAWAQSPGLVSQPVRISEEKDPFRLLVKRGDGSLLTAYYLDSQFPKPFLYPLTGPGGVEMTRAYPMISDRPGETRDHPHQRSVWFTYGDVIPEGIELKQRPKGVAGVDFWAETPLSGRIVCEQILLRQDGESGRPAVIRTRNSWQTADGRKILDEIRTLQVFDLGQGESLLVFDFLLQATECDITFGDTKEGAFGVRVADSMTERAKKGGVLTNADGKRTMAQCWGRRSAWCGYSGPVGERIVGLTLMDHPKNPSPACWHARDYGLLAANPFGRQRSGFPDVQGQSDLIRLKKGETLRWRYGLLVHDGDSRQGRVAERYTLFTQLPLDRP
ncbi:MAG: PmoA family protein [Gemmatales bacterium]|nr:PmoA family protein [Gemmatales bacterium]